MKKIACLMFCSILAVSVVVKADLLEAQKKLRAEDIPYEWVIIGGNNG